MNPKRNINPCYFELPRQSVSVPLTEKAVFCFRDWKTWVNWQTSHFKVNKASFHHWDTFNKNRIKRNCHILAWIYQQRFGRPTWSSSICHFLSYYRMQMFEGNCYLSDNSCSLFSCFFPLAVRMLSYQFGQCKTFPNPRIAPRRGHSC